MIISILSQGNIVERRLLHKMKNILKMLKLLIIIKILEYLKNDNE